MTDSAGMVAQLLAAAAAPQRAADPEKDWPRVLALFQQAALEEKSAVLRQLVDLHALKNRCMDAASHDLRGDVAAIRGFSELLGAELPPESSGQEYVAVITGLATKLLVAMHDLLDFRLIEEGGFVLHRREGDLTELLRRCLAGWTPVATAHGCTVHEELAAVPPCFFDAGRLEQVVEQLLEFVVQGAPTDSSVRVRLAVVGGRAEFVLEDAGPAVSEAELAQWFLPAGGPNLSLARRIVESHYGTLTVANLPCQGRRFSFTIPVHT
ncbi:MAG: HAMP domain-containing sensor histidine kinase [Thermodesulfobacteriota bacterium]